MREKTKAGLVFIPAAGLGSRVSEMGISKPLLSIGDQPLIWRIMDLYPSETRFVVAVGHEGEILSEVLNLYGRLRGSSVTVTQTNSHLTPTGGLSQTLRDSASELQEPFVFHACDTYLDDQPTVLEQLLNSDENQVLSSRIDHKGTYRSFAGGNFEKRDLRNGDSAYLGVAKISDWQAFWEAFLAGSSIYDSEDGEAVGLRGITTKNIELHYGVWFDAGTPDGLQKLKAGFSTQGHVLPKSDEAIWLRGDLMIKVHKSSAFISGRMTRSLWLANFVPECSQEGQHIFTYKRIHGRVLSSCEEASCFKELLNHCQHFWSNGAKDSQLGNFLEFYKVKTYARVEDYLNKHPLDAKLKSVNGFPVAEARFILDNLPWEDICLPLVGFCHGDLHPENIIHDHSEEKFTFLDWRQDIGGSTKAEGDVYYDLAKLLHGLIVDHGSVSRNEYQVVDSSDSEVNIRIQLHHQKREWIGTFLEFLKVEAFSLVKVWQLTALIFLNIATLHHENYDRFLFALGMRMISTDVREVSEILDFVDDADIFYS